MLARIKQVIGSRWRHPWVVQTADETAMLFVWRAQFKGLDRQECEDWLQHNGWRSTAEFPDMWYKDHNASPPSHDNWPYWSKAHFLALPELPWKDAYEYRFDALVLVPDGTRRAASEGGYWNVTVVGVQFGKPCRLVRMGGPDVVEMGDRYFNGAMLVQECRLDWMPGSGLACLTAHGSQQFQVTANLSTFRVAVVTAKNV
jgi:hypothetical protein